jgi:hypothetical protein
MDTGDLGDGRCEHHGTVEQIAVQVKKARS